MGGGYGGTPMMDPLAYGNEGMGQGGIGTNDFVITDLDYDETGRQVCEVFSSLFLFFFPSARIVR